MFQFIQKMQTKPEQPQQSSQSQSQCPLDNKPVVTQANSSQLLKELFDNLGRIQEPTLAGIFGHVLQALADGATVNQTSETVPKIVSPTVKVETTGPVAALADNKDTTRIPSNLVNDALDQLLPTESPAPAPVEEVEIVPSVHVDPNFQLKLFANFNAEYEASSHTLNRIRARHYFCTGDLSDPSLSLLLTSLEHLELITQLVCACIPPSGIVNDLVTAKKVQKLVTLSRGLVDAVPVANVWNNSGLVSACNDAKKVLKNQKNSPKKQKTSVDERAYAPKVHHHDKYFNALIKFATRFAKVCRAMYCQAYSTWTEVDRVRKTDRVKGAVASFKYLSIQLPVSCFTPMDPEILRRSQLAPDAIGVAFSKLDAQCTSNNNNSIDNIDCAGLAKQKNAQAIVIYTVLWHVFATMHKKGWLTQKQVAAVCYKLGSLDDARCIKYKVRNSEGKSYVYKPLIPFWKEKKSYAGICEILKLNDQGNQVTTTSKERVAEFFSALFRYALANTPVTAKRSPELVAWIKLIHGEARNLLLPTLAYVL